MKNSAATKTPAINFFALAFGLFLGLCIWKFGNPVILDHKIPPPGTLTEFLNEPWPLHWANWILLPLAILGGLLAFQPRRLDSSNSPAVTGAAIFNLPSSILCFLPLTWLGWQFLAATQTVDAALTRVTLWQLSGCVASYFLGALVFARNDLWRWLLPGLLAAFVFCLVRGITQHVFEFPQNYQMLVTGERVGWTNFPPETIAEMKAGGVIVTTNGVDVANPILLDKIKKGRVAGTLVYPNALAGIILLLWPVSLSLAFGATTKLKPWLRLAVIALTIFLGGAAFYWSGSKLGWLIGLGIAGLLLLRLDWPRKLKLLAVAVMLVIGLGMFAVRFHHYFAAGATSASARFDYWRAAVQTAATHPLFGTGPGTFQRAYAGIKAPESEMARLAHNDYLEQFSDSGIPGGLIYTVWIILALTVLGKKLWRTENGLIFFLFVGIFGWFMHGFGEFGLYIPALAWPAFVLLGTLIGKVKPA